jgi:NAD(P)-dependent dehydrogenase (short-subunit alcohol dehydrogenase family)
MPVCAARTMPSIRQAGVGKPDDVAELVAWLLDGKRSGFVTGANFVIDGGMTRKMIYEE